MRTINPSMLETARLIRGYTQKEAASILNISQGKLSKAEQGIQSLDDNTLMNITKTYDFPISFFCIEDDYSPDGHLYFRRKLGATGKELAGFLSKIKILKKIVDTLFASIEMPICSLKTYDPGIYSPEEIAQKTRFSMQIYKGRVPNLATLLEAHGIIIFPFDFGTDKIDGLSVITSQGHKIIFSNSQMPEDRKRFSLAHELGHLIMHFDSVPKFEETVEDEANRFASEYLLPAEEIVNDLNFLNFEKLGMLKRKWHVSMRAILHKARNLGCINDKTYRNFQINFSKKGYNKTEPILLPLERPTFIQDTLSLYKTELGYNDEELQSLMRINKTDYNYFFTPSKVIPLFKI